MSIMEILIGIGVLLFLGQIGYGLEYYFMHKGKR